MYWGHGEIRTLHLPHLNVGVIVIVYWGHGEIRTLHLPHLNVSVIVIAFKIVNVINTILDIIEVLLSLILKSIIIRY